MSIDVATLVFEFKSDSAATAEQRMDKLIEKGERLDAVAKKVRLATDRVNEGYRGAAGAAERAAQGATALAQAEGAVEKATQASLTRQGVSWREFVSQRMGDYMRLEGGHSAAMKRIGAEWQAYKATATDAAQGAATAMTASQGAVEKATRQAGQASADTRAQRALEAAAMREKVAADKAYERGLAQAARATQQQAAAVERLRLSTDPLAAAQERVNQEMREANRLFMAGAIAGDEWARSVTVLKGRLESMGGIHQAGAKGARLQAYELANLGSQFADVGVSLASGQALWLVATQQGAQIGGIWGSAAARGATLGATIKQLASTVMGFVAALAPALALIGAAVGAFFLWRKHVEDTKKAIEATKKATAAFVEVQNTVRDALSSAIDFAEKYSVTNTGLATALDKVLISQNSAYGATLASIGANDAAGQSAARRAEMERLLTVSILKRAAAEAQDRAKEADRAAKAARGPARTSGAWVAMGLGPDAAAIVAGQAAEAEKFKKLGGEAAAKAAAQEREYAKTLNASADALMKATLVIPPATKATVAHGAAVKAAASDTDDFDRRATPVAGKPGNANREGHAGNC